MSQAAIYATDYQGKTAQSLAAETHVKYKEELRQIDPQGPFADSTKFLKTCQDEERKPLQEVIGHFLRLIEFPAGDDRLKELIGEVVTPEQFQKLLAKRRDYRLSRKISTAV